SAASCRRACNARASSRTSRPRSTGVRVAQAGCASRAAATARAPAVALERATTHSSGASAGRDFPNVAGVRDVRRAPPTMFSTVGRDRAMGANEDRRIAIVASELLGRPGTGGAGTADSLLAVALGRHGYLVDLIVASGREIGELNPEWTSIYESAGVKITVLERSTDIKPTFLAPTYEV